MFMNVQYMLTIITSMKTCCIINAVLLCYHSSYSNIDLQAQTGRVIVTLNQVHFSVLRKIYSVKCE